MNGKWGKEQKIVQGIRKTHQCRLSGDIVPRLPLVLAHVLQDAFSSLTPLLYLLLHLIT
jgi:hypothetical protein